MIRWTVQWCRHFSDKKIISIHHASVKSSNKSTRGHSRRGLTLHVEDSLPLLQTWAATTLSSTKVSLVFSSLPHQYPIIEGQKCLRSDGLGKIQLHPSLSLSLSLYVVMHVCVCIQRVKWMSHTGTDPENQSKRECRALFHPM